LVVAEVWVTRESRHLVTVSLRSQDYCESQHIVRHGEGADGRQRYLCRDCGERRGEQPRSKLRVGRSASRF
jgi:transposase-like protein